MDYDELTKNGINNIKLTCNPPKGCSNNLAGYFQIVPES